MSIEQIYIAEQYDETKDKRGLVITGNRQNESPFPLVRSDFNMVHLPVLWKRGRYYRIFSAVLLNRIYQLRKKTKSVSALWEQGIPVNTKVGKILSGK